MYGEQGFKAVHKTVHLVKFIGKGCSIFFESLLRATREARNPNLQVVVTHASLECSQHSFGLPPRMNGMHRTQLDYARLDHLSLEI